MTSPIPRTPFSPHALMTACEGEANLAASILREAPETIRGFIEKLNTAIESRDGHLLAMAAHQVLNTATLFGQADLQEASRSLETVARSRRIESAIGKAVHLCAGLRRFHNELLCFLDPFGPTPDLDIETLAHWLDENRER
ncbi:MAG: hypothetical protein ACFE0O_11220 [Opitutales bacterium]